MRRGAAEGWPLVGWASLALVAMCAAILFAAGTGEEGLRMAIRATARTSVVLFALAFSASSLRRLWRHEVTAWLLRNRRQLGVSFAVSHTIHLAVIVEAAVRFPEFRAGIEWLTIVFGGLAYVLLWAMTATSFDRSATWLGRRRWRQLHLVGGWYVWFVFAQSYLPRAATTPTYLPAAALVLAIAGLRATVWLRDRRSSEVAPGRTA